MKKHSFYVVIIDDNKTVCERIKDKLIGTTIHDDRGIPITVDVKTVHVTLEENDTTSSNKVSNWSFTKMVFSQLAEAAFKKPDLIIVDYGFASNSAAKVINDKANRNELDQDTLFNLCLVPLDLRDWVEESAEFSRNDRRKIINNIFDTKNSVYLHSYTPQNLSSIVGPFNDRIKKTQLAFPNSFFQSINMRSELFNDEEFDWPSPSMYDRDYYPYQLAVIYEQIVQKEFYKREIGKNKYMKIKTTSFSVSMILSIGSAIGFASAWVGSLFFESLKNKNFFEVFAYGGSLLFTIFIFGIASPLLFEKLMRKIIQE